MNLYELAFTCYIYNYFTSFNRTYEKFRTLVGGEVNLFDDEHRQHLIDWLNDWGCRQFSLKDHDLASKEILSWYKEVQTDLHPDDKKLWELTELELEGISGIYNSLLKRKASQGSRRGQSFSKTVGPTGASKILFALRPESTVPWDDAIRKGLNHGCDGSAYVDYLKRSLAEIYRLAESCSNNGIELISLPGFIKRESATVAQLVGEYFWITETRKCFPPPPETIESWVGWLQKDASYHENNQKYLDEASNLEGNFSFIPGSKGKKSMMKDIVMQNETGEASYPLITHGKGHQFRVDCDLQQERIIFSYPPKTAGSQRENDIFTFNEIFRICQYLKKHFERNSFPLANNVERLHAYKESKGLGMAIRTLPQTVASAQAASYLGPYLEKIGVLKVIVPRPARWKLVVEPEMVIDYIKEYHEQA